MAHRQVGKLHPPAVEKAVACYEEGVGPLAHKSCEGRIDLADGAGIMGFSLQPHGASSRFQVSHCSFGVGNTVRIDEHGQARGGGYHLTQKFQPFCRQLDVKEIDTG
jgi:hypothetical protein